MHNGSSPSELSEMYFQNLQQQFGAAVELEPMFRWE
jgi:hypothetical protein